jgi:ERCC4-type nuclease
LEPAVTERVIQVDGRAGSSSLVYSLRIGGLNAELARLDYGDIRFNGYGPDGECSIGIEYKRLNDLLKSCRDGRLAGHQVPGMVRTYQFRYLLVLGQWREGDSGLLEIPVRGGWMQIQLGASGFLWRELEGYLQTLELRCGFHVRRCRTVADVISAVKSIYLWFGRPWDQHRSHKTIYSPPPDRVLYQKPSLLRRVAKELPGVGWERSGAIAERYRSVMDLCCASPGELAQIPGIGKKTAMRIVRSLAGQQDEEDGHEPGK